MNANLDSPKKNCFILQPPPPRNWNPGSVPDDVGALAMESRLMKSKDVLLV